MVSSWNDNIVKERRYLLLWDGLKATAIIAVAATLFGTALGALVCFMRMSKSRLLSAPARIYVAIVRGIPVVVLLMVIFYVVFAAVDVNAMMVAVIAFGMNFAAYVSEMFRAGIESVDKGQSEAGTAMGFTKAQTFGFIILPQMIQRVLPVYKGEFISLVKMTSIVGYIAVQDLTKAGDIIRSRTFDAFFPLILVAVLYFLISWMLTQALDHLERMTDPKYRRRRATHGDLVRRSRRGKSRTGMSVAPNGGALVGRRTGGANIPKRSTDERRNHELGSHRGQLEAVQGQGEGGVGQADRRRSHHARW